MFGCHSAISWLSLDEFDALPVDDMQINQRCLGLGRTCTPNSSGRSGGDQCDTL